MESIIVSMQMINIIFHCITGGHSTNPIPSDADLVKVGSTKLAARDLGMVGNQISSLELIDRYII
jgi:hypothetical protein